MTARAAVEIEARAQPFAGVGPTRDGTEFVEGLRLALNIASCATLSPGSGPPARAAGFGLGGWSMTPPAGGGSPPQEAIKAAMTAIKARMADNVDPLIPLCECVWVMCGTPQGRAQDWRAKRDATPTSFGAASDNSLLTVARRRRASACESW
jgi:hypothetical protein